MDAFDDDELCPLGSIQQTAYTFLFSSNKAGATFLSPAGFSFDKILHTTHGHVQNNMSCGFYGLMLGERGGRHQVTEQIEEGSI